MDYSIKVNGSKEIFGEIFKVEHEMFVSCAESEERAFNLISKVLRSKMFNVCIEISDTDDRLRGRIETDCLGEITLYLYHIGQYNAEVILLWPWRDEHKLTATEVYNIVHRKIL